MLHLVGCLYYLFQWSTVKQISDNEIYLLIKYIKSVLWRVAKCLSYIEEAWCLKVKRMCRVFLRTTCYVTQFVQVLIMESDSYTLWKSLRWSPWLGLRVLFYSYFLVNIACFLYLNFMSQQSGKLLFFVLFFTELLMPILFAHYLQSGSVPSTEAWTLQNRRNKKF